MATVQRDGLVGRTVDGRYTVLTHLADGGMGNVYAALDTRLDRQVALKVMRPDLARDPEFVQRFRREARAAARLSHPNVVAVFDQGEDEGVLFLAMEFVDGQTLRDLLDERGALTPAEALGITAQILEGTRAAHRRDVLHRDIKPENVLHSAEGQIKVADFGLARAMGATTATGRTGPLLGTVAYLAPEQVEHGTADARTDLYAIGLVLHEMLTGRAAVEGDSPIHLAWQHVNGTLATPSSQVPELPAALDDLVGRATRRDPADRFPDADAFLTAVRTTLDSLDADALTHRPRPSRGDSTTHDAPDTHGTDDTHDTERDAPAAAIAPEDAARLRRTGPLVRHTRRLSRDDLPARREHLPVTSPVAATLDTAAEATTDDPPADPHPRPEIDSKSAAHEGGRRNHRALWATLAALLLIASGAAYWWFGPPGQRTVPAVVAADSVTAEDALRAQDLTPITEQAFSETIPRDRVISTDAPAGTVVHRGSRVRLVVSRGPERYDVPNLAGRTAAEAAPLLAEAHLAVGETRETYDDSVPRGAVVRTDPVAGTAARPGTRVALVVSKGRAPVPLTGIVGLPRSEAVARLEKAGLLVEVAKARVFSTPIPAGAVAATTPSGTVHRGDTVTLTLSKGPEMIAVPAVQGMTEDEARAALRAAGFEVRVNRILGGVFGTARSTEPAGGVAPKGSVVVLNVV